VRRGQDGERLLTDPRSTSYGVEKVWELNSLDARVEYAVCLPWFKPFVHAARGRSGGA
jgi:hypothetical protein